MAIFIKRLAASLALCGTMIAAPAFAWAADTAPDAPTKTVRYTDLDLATDAGVATLHARVRRAVALVCGDADNRDLTRMQQINACRRVALARAEPQIAMALAAAHDGKALASADNRAIRMPGS